MQAFAKNDIQRINNKRKPDGTRALYH